MMNIEQCQNVVRLERLPQKDFIGWTDSEKTAFCKHFYNLLDEPVYNNKWNPYTQGELFCEAMGIDLDKRRDILEAFEMHFEDKIEELLRCSF